MYQWSFCFDQRLILGELLIAIIIVLWFTMLSTTLKTHPVANKHLPSLSHSLTIFLSPSLSLLYSRGREGRVAGREGGTKGRREGGRLGGRKG